MPQVFHKLRISSNSKKEKSPEALNFQGILAKVHEVDTILQETAMQQLSNNIILLLLQRSI